jgi:hypothetical protein
MSSPACRLEKITYRGFEAFMLENELVRCVVVPALGGKLASLVHLPTMREWLWRNPHMEIRPGVYGGDYVGKHDVGGWDECFPSVAATRHPTAPWEGTSIPDHGEIWGLPWKAEPFCDGSRIELRLVVHGVRFPYRFERTLTMEAGEGGLRLAYSVTNLTGFAFPFLWSAHPIFAATPGMKIVAPLRDLTVYSSADKQFGALGRPVTWPLVTDVDGRAWDLAALPDPSANLAVKLYGRSPVQGYVALQDIVQGAELRMQFDPADVTHLGLWLNYGGWSGATNAPPYFNLGIEPCIGAQDDLALAVRHFEEYGELPPNGRQAWQVDLLLR